MTASAPPPPLAAPPIRRDEVEPVSAELRRFHVTVSRRFLEKLSAARDALSHTHPGAETGVVLEAALDLLLAAHEKKNPPRPPASTRHIPAEVKRAVWLRDGGRCQWPIASGGICGSTTRVEYDYIVPLARGGSSTVGELRLLCRRHNFIHAEQTYSSRAMPTSSTRGRTRDSPSAGHAFAAACAMNCCRCSAPTSRSGCSGRPRARWPASPTGSRPASRPCAHEPQPTARPHHARPRSRRSGAHLGTNPWRARATPHRRPRRGRPGPSRPRGTRDLARRADRAISRGERRRARPAGPAPRGLDDARGSRAAARPRGAARRDAPPLCGDTSGGAGDRRAIAV